MTRNLAMHVWPTERPGAGAWRLTCREIAKRWSVFDGTKTIAIACGHDTASVDEVRRVFPSDARFLCVKNSPSLREVASFHALMEIALASPGRTLYCHGKGASHGADSICQERARAMIEVTLDNLDLVDHALDNFRCAGCFKRPHRFGIAPNNWHYSGTFFWVNNDDLVFEDDRWRAIDDVWFGVESWPGRTFESSQAACLFLDDCGDLYDPEYWRMVVRPRLETWRRSPRIATELPDPSSCRLARLRPGYSKCVRCGRVVHDVRMFQRYECGKLFHDEGAACPHAMSSITKIGDAQVLACERHGACSAMSVPDADVHVCERLS